MDAMDLLQIAKARSALASGAAVSVRRDAQLSRADIAAVLDVAPTTVFRWETGKRKPRGEVAVRYAALLDLIEQRAA